MALDREIEERINKRKAQLQELVDSQPLTYEETRSLSFHGVYAIYEGEGDDVLYVGTIKEEGRTIRSRLTDLFGDGISHTLHRKLLRRFDNDRERVRHFLREKCSYRAIRIADLREAALFEHFAISALEPPYND